MEDEKQWQDAKEVEANWFKFTKVGDKIKGTLLSKNLQKGTARFPDQYVYEIKTDDDLVINVGISVKKKGTVQRLNSCKLGQIIGIKLESITPTEIKGFADTKNLKVFDFGMDKEFTFDHDENGEEIVVENLPL